MTCGFRLQISNDQRTVWVTKKSIKLKFTRSDSDGFYRLHTKRAASVSVYHMAKTMSTARAIETVHNQLGHTGADAIKRMIAKECRLRR